MAGLSDWNISTLMGSASGPRKIDSLDDWITALLQPTALTEVAVLLACIGISWLVIRMSRRTASKRDEYSILFGRRTVDGVLFPLLLFVLSYISRTLLIKVMPVAVFKVAVPVLLSLVVIRIIVKVLQAAFKNAPLVRALERTFSWAAWLFMVVWVSGLLPVMLDELDSIKWKIGSSTVSVRNMLEGAVTASIVIIIALWISAAIESRLLRSAKGGELSLRKALSNASRAILLFFGLMVALTAVGIDLSALSVIAGAVGVGIGFGLQKIAASYVSGFVMLAERSVRIGDSVKVDGFEGVITDIKARYTVVRSLMGRESIVPNEIFISNRIENFSLTDLQVVLFTTITVSYDSDPDQVMALLKDAAVAQKRVLKEPPPSVNLVHFAADGLEFVLYYSINDPENGQQNVSSLVNLHVLRSFREHGIDIPYPQRVVHLAPGTLNGAGAPPSAKPADSEPVITLTPTLLTDIASVDDKGDVSSSGAAKPVAPR
jgi:small-conductance mechanosensitive channel